MSLIPSLVFSRYFTYHMCVCCGRMDKILYHEDPTQTPYIYCTGPGCLVEMCKECYASPTNRMKYVMESYLSIGAMMCYYHHQHSL